MAAQKAESVLIGFFIIITLLSCLNVSRVRASELLDGFVVSIDKTKKVMTVKDRESGENRLVSYGSSKEAAEIKSGSHVKLWISEQKKGVFRVEKIYGSHGQDMTGIKRRLRKAAGSRGCGMHGHKGRGRGGGHGGR